MKIIPVIDIKNGQVVRAIKGERSNYRPVKSMLCSTSDPLDVVSAFIETTKTKTIYIADLDAIENSEDNYSTILELAKSFPELSLWVDAGFRSQKQINYWKKIPHLIPVIGTESHSNLASISPLLKDEIILSLDFKNDQLLGPAQILEAIELWPQNVIVMTLEVIGGDKGPNLALLDQVKSTSPQTHFFAAGGIRHNADLNQLKARGVVGVLIASALHDQTLSLAGIYP